MLQVTALIHVLSHPALHPIPCWTQHLGVQCWTPPPGFCWPSLSLPSKAQPVPARLSQLTLVMVVRREGEMDTVGSGTCVLARRGLFVIFRPVPALGLTGKRGALLQVHRVQEPWGFRDLSASTQIPHPFSGSLCSPAGPCPGCRRHIVVEDLTSTGAPPPSVQWAE